MRLEQTIDVRHPTERVKRACGRRDFFLTRHEELGLTNLSVHRDAGDGARGFRGEPIEWVGNPPAGGHVVRTVPHARLLPTAALARWVGRAVLSSALLVGSAAAEGWSFPAETYPSVDEPSKLLVADLNGDSRLDVVARSFVTDHVGVHPGLGNGRLAPVVLFPVGDGPLDVAAGDLDGDSVPDLVTTNLHSDDVSVLLGVGDGSFLPAAAVPAGDGCRAVAIADIDADTVPDLVVANGGDDTVMVFLGQGDGSFQLASTLQVGDFPVDVAAADLNGDQQLDIVTLNNGGDDASILLGLGGTSFLPPLPVPVGNLPKEMEVADVNGDGNLDLATRFSSTSGDRIGVLLGNGNGTFQAPIEQGVPELVSIAVAHVDGDAFLDLALGRESRGAYVLMGNGDGSFQAPVLHEVGPGYKIRDVAVADLDEDGAPELVTANSVRDSVTVLEGEPGDSFVGPIYSTFGSTDGDEASMDLSDVNGDGQTDVVAVHATPGYVSYSAALGDGEGGLSNPGTHFLDFGGYSQSVAAEDLDGDAIPDLAIANRGGTVTVLIGDGDANFQVSDDEPVMPTPQALIVGDLNGDAHPDVATANGSNSVSVLLGAGDGTLQAALTKEFYSAADPVSLFAGDLDGDGDLDLATANENTDDVIVLLNAGDGTFPPGLPRYSVGERPAGVSGADLNGDAVLDLVTAHRDGDDVGVLLGLGDGTFSPVALFEAGSEPISIAVADVDRDGHVDVAVTLRVEHLVSVLLGNGDGTLRAPRFFAAGREPDVLHAEDVNGDGLPDLVSLTGFTGYTYQFEVATSLPEPRGVPGLLIGAGVLALRSRRRAPVAPPAR